MVANVKRRRLTPEAWKKLDQYESVSICCTEQACSAARTLAGERYLLEDAPPLPLPWCDSSTCNCTLVSHRDRRNFLGNRRSLDGLAPQDRNTPGSNRRSGEDRRSIKVDFRHTGRSG